MSDETQHELADHEVDGIRELDNDLPRWWLYGFYVTIVIGVVYFVNYHVLATPLVGKATVAEEYAVDVAAAKAGQPAAAVATAFVLRTDAASLAKGDAIFHGATNACHACHREDLGGLIGPNLTDAFWLHGCQPAEIAKNITTGFPEKGMQPYGTTARLSDDDLASLVSYVLSKQGSTPPDPKAVEPERDKACTSAPAAD